MAPETADLRVRLPPDVFEKLRQAAFDQRTSMNALVIDALRKQQESHAHCEFCGE